MEQPNRKQIEGAFDPSESFISIQDSSPGMETQTPERAPIDFGRLIRKYALLAVLLVPVGTAGGFLSVALTPTVFKAQALIQIQPISGSILKMQNVEDF